MPSPPHETFLTALRTTRKARGMSQGEVAAAINLSRAQYTAIENGRSAMNLQHLFNLSRVLKVRFSIGDEKHPLATKVTE